MKGCWWRLSVYNGYVYQEGYLLPNSSVAYKYIASQDNKVGGDFCLQMGTLTTLCVHKAYFQQRKFILSEEKNSPLAFNSFLWASSLLKFLISSVTTI